MRRKFQFLLAFLICFNVMPFNIVSAEENKIQKDQETIQLNEFDFKRECGITENNSLIKNELNQDAQEKGALMKAVIFLVTSIASGVTYEAVKYIATYKSDMTAVHEWAAENGYNLSDFNINITKVVYDNGCWKPEFSANPFCRSISSEK